MAGAAGDNKNKVTGKKICPACGSDKSPQIANFCVGCGVSFSAQEVATNLSLADQLRQSFHVPESPKEKPSRELPRETKEILAPLSLESEIVVDPEEQTQSVASETKDWVDKGSVLQPIEYDATASLMALLNAQKQVIPDAAKPVTKIIKEKFKSPDERYAEKGLEALIKLKVGLANESEEETLIRTAVVGLGLPEAKISSAHSGRRVDYVATAKAEPKRAGSAALQGALVPEVFAALQRLSDNQYDGHYETIQPEDENENAKDNTLRNHLIVLFAVFVVSLILAIVFGNLLF